MRIIFVSAFIALAAFATGCRSYQYQGTTYEPTPKVEVFDKPEAAIPPHTVMGTCMIEGTYDLKSRDALVRKLRSVARSKGANAVKITGSRVIPEGSVSSSSPWALLSDNAAFAQMERDFSGGYGVINKSEQRAATYRRILRAEFLRYNEQPVFTEDSEGKALKQPQTEPKTKSAPSPEKTNMEPAKKSTP